MHTELSRLKKDLKEMDWEDVYWIHLAQDGLQWRVFVNMAMKFRVTEKKSGARSQPPVSCVHVRDVVSLLFAS
jgi:hypothetical protein